MKDLREFVEKIVNEVLNEENSKGNPDSESNSQYIIAYHRSPKKFYKFDISNVGNYEHRQLSGWGLYFSNIIPSKEYGDYLYKVKLFKDKKEYFLLDTKEPVEENIVNKILETLNKYNKKSDEVIEFAYSGWLFYRTLSRILGNDKRVSLFLLENGIDGLKKNENKNWHDYILFNDNDIIIEDIKYDPY
jgi:hypothetical protein